MAVERETWELRWEEQSPGSFTLRSGDAALARLERVDSWTSWLDAADRRWTIGKVGFLRPCVVVRPEGTFEEAARLETTGPGVNRALRFGETQCTFERVDDAEIRVRDAGGQTLLRGRRELVDGRWGAAIEVEPTLRWERALLLAALAWHVLLVDLEDPRRPVSVTNGVVSRRSPRDTHR